MRRFTGWALRPWELCSSAGGRARRWLEATVEKLVLQYSLRFSSDSDCWKGM